MTTPHSNTMPFASLQGFGLFQIVLMTAQTSIVIIETSHHPNTMDAYALIGALVAASFVVYEGRYRDRGISSVVTVSLVSLFAGVVLPGVILNQIFKAQIPTFTWHVWGLLGLLSGLLGWVISASVYSIGQKLIPYFLQKEVERRTNIKLEDKE